MPEDQVSLPVVETPGQVVLEDSVSFYNVGDSEIFVPGVSPRVFRNEGVVVKAAGKFFRVILPAAEIKAVAPQLQMLYGFHAVSLLIF